MLCDRDEVEAVLHFLVICEELEWERHELLRIGDIEGLDMWFEDFTEEDHVGKMAGQKIEDVIMAKVWR